MSPSDEGLNRGRKRKKKQQKKEKAKEVAEDRISRLSDEILHRVMSFMNTKYAVQTCVLSKRWKFLWKSLPYLNFSLQTFLFKRDRKEDQEKEDPKMKAYIIIHRGEEVPQMKSYEYYNTQLEEEEEDPKMISFENFITQVLSRRYHTDLVKVWFFTQKYYLGYKIWKLYSSALEWLISYAVDRNVQQLNIQSEFYNGFELSENFYICQSLETFNVHASSNILPKFMSLPALKSLHLWGLEITTNWFNPMNLSGCPNLESLKLIDIHCGQEPKKTLDLSCTWYKPRGESLEVFDLRDKTLFVNAPNLKRLELSFRRSSKEDGCKVVIGAPGLMTFQYRGFYPIVCSSVDLVSIDDVCFDIYNGYKINPMIVEKALDVNHERVLGLINTFKAFRHAKSITLPLETVQALARFPSLRVENQFTYSNLKYLKIELQRSCNGIEIPGCVLNIFLNSYTKLRFCQHRSPRSG